MPTAPIEEDLDLGRVSQSVSDIIECGDITDPVDETFDMGEDLYSYLYTQFSQPLVNDLVFTALGRIATSVLSYDLSSGIMKISAFPELSFTRDDSKYQEWYVSAQKYIKPTVFRILPNPDDSTVILEAENYTQNGQSITVDENTEVTYTVSRVGYHTVTNSYLVTESTVLPITLTKQNYTLTIDTTPSDATVTFNTGTVSGKTCTVSYDTDVTYTISRYGYATVTNTVNIRSDRTISVALTKNNYTLSISPTPSDATVTLTAAGYVQSGKSITVPYLTSVSYSVSRGGYVTQTGTITVESTNTVQISLTKQNYTLTISPTPSDATVTLTAAGYVQSGNSITVPYETNVSYSVSKSEYITKSGSLSVTSSQTINVSLVKLYKFTINANPSVSTVKITATGYTQSGNYIWVPSGTVISYSVSCQGYNTQSSTYTMASADYSISVTLSKQYTPGQVVFNSSTPGNFSKTLTVPGQYNIEYSGGGGSGSSVSLRSTSGVSNRTQQNGYNGQYLSLTTTVSINSSLVVSGIIGGGAAGSYTYARSTYHDVVQGTPGSGYAAGSKGTTDGGNNWILCGGSGGGSTSVSLGSNLQTIAKGGNGGSCNVTIKTVGISTAFSASGGTGGSGGITNGTGSAGGAFSYGAGTNSGNTSGAGTNGYVKITFVG